MIQIRNGPRLSPMCGTYGRCSSWLMLLADVLHKCHTAGQPAPASSASLAIVPTVCYRPPSEAQGSWNRLPRHREADWRPIDVLSDVHVKYPRTVDCNDCFSSGTVGGIAVSGETVIWLTQDLDLSAPGWDRTNEEGAALV